MGQLADRIAALVRRIDPEWTLEQDELAAIATRAEIIELDNESLAAINARVEKENDLMQAVVEAARANVPQWKIAALDDALDALERWRLEHEVPHG